MKRNKGFTVIELLVVGCVIGILFAILVPIFQQAKKAALLRQQTTDGVSVLERNR
jgi:type II secretory pathway pseudopilin PulG